MTKTKEKGKNKDHGLTHKQKVFADEYIDTRNATQSVKKAYGYEDDNLAGVTGHDNLRKPKIVDYFADKLEDVKSVIYDIAMVGTNEGNRLKAATTIVERIEGKAMQNVNQHNTGDVSINLISYALDDDSDDTV